MYICKNSFISSRGIRYAIDQQIIDHVYWALSEKDKVKFEKIVQNKTYSDPSPSSSVMPDFNFFPDRDPTPDTSSDFGGFGGGDGGGGGASGDY